MTDIQWILFSKNRTLQAKSCIDSFISLSDVDPKDIIILYTDSDDISYEPLKEEFSCRFVKQTDFYKDITDIVKEVSKSFIGFMVDDLIFRDRFSCAQIEGVMKRYQDLDCFSLRLGKNIEDGRSPVFEELELDIISWKTAKGLGKTWNYFWEVSSSIYRKKDVIEYLELCSGKIVSFPNPLEFYYYDIMPNFYVASLGVSRILANPRYLLWALLCPQKRVKRMACFEKSRSFTQGVNLVADLRQGYKTYITPESLHELFTQGHRIDFECLRDVVNTKPNLGNKYFRIVSRDGKIHPLSVFK